MNYKELQRIPRRATERIPWMSKESLGVLWNSFESLRNARSQQTSSRAQRAEPPRGTPWREAPRASMDESLGPGHWRTDQEPLWERPELLCKLTRKEQALRFARALNGNYGSY